MLLLHFKTCLCVTYDRILLLCQPYTISFFVMLVVLMMYSVFIVCLISFYCCIFILVAYYGAFVLLMNGTVAYDVIHDWYDTKPKPKRGIDMTFELFSIKVSKCLKLVRIIRFHKL